MIVKTKTGYEVKSENTGRNLGKMKTKKQAIKRLKQVEYFKHRKEISSSNGKTYI